MKYLKRYNFTFELSDKDLSKIREDVKHTVESSTGLISFTTELMSRQDITKPSRFIDEELVLKMNIDTYSISDIIFLTTLLDSHEEIQK